MNRDRRVQVNRVLDSIESINANTADGGDTAEIVIFLLKHMDKEYLIQALDTFEHFNEDNAHISHEGGSDD